MATALNLADIDLCRELSISREVAVYIPKDTNYLYLRAGKKYSYADKNKISAANSPALESNVRQTSLYLNDESYIDVASIVSSEIIGYSEYPPSSYNHGIKIPVLPDGLHHHVEELAAVIDTDAPALILTKGLDEDKFLVFKALIMPVITSIEEGFNQSCFEKYKIRTPDYAHNTLLYRTVLHLFPSQPDLVEQFTRAGLVEEQRMHARKPGSGPTSYVPTGAYDFT